MSALENSLEGFYAALRNLNKLEHQSFREVIKSQFNPTLRERYLTVNYHRAALNVEMMLEIKDTKQFQALSLLARTIFELAVEIKSINLDPSADKKIELFSKVERLRAARKMVKFKKEHSNEWFHHETQEKFINNCGAQIDSDEAAMWPVNPTTGKRAPLHHWTLKKLPERANDLGSPFDRIYNVHYPELSWMSHSGVISPLNMTTEWITAYVGIVYSIAVDSYMQILETLVNEFRLYVTDQYLKKKIICDRDLGFTNTREGGEEVLNKHGLAWYFEPPKLYSDA